MSHAELARGPRRGRGPDVAGPWTVLSLKSEGITPGFVIRDQRGDKYLIKLDPRDFPQMTTSAEVISTALFHAIGYNVPENHLAMLDPERLAIDPSAVVIDASGRKRPLTRKHIDARLSAVPVDGGGHVQVLASLYLSGTPLGPFKFFGTRGDDANDIFPHEHRRELRGLNVFAAWLNHNDSDAANTLDVYVRDNGRDFVRHYLIDFGTTLGSGGFEPHSKRAGNEHYFERAPTLKSALTFGVWDRPWRAITYPDLPSIGRFESHHFRPDQWKPDYPNPAFERMQPADSFWAASIVARFDDERIRTIVRTGELRDSVAEKHLVATLIERRDKILRHYLLAASPIGQFSLDDESLRLNFENLAELHHLGSVTGYRYQWFHFDNDTMALTAATEPRLAYAGSIPIPRAGRGYWMVRIETLSPDAPSWQRPVDVYLRREADAGVVVGIERTFE